MPFPDQSKSSVDTAGCMKTSRPIAVRKLHTTKRQQLQLHMKEIFFFWYIYGSVFRLKILVEKTHWSKANFEREKNRNVAPSRECIIDENGVNSVKKWYDWLDMSVKT